MSLIESLAKVGGEFSSVLTEGTFGDNSGFIDTGSYSLNALLSGSIYGGFPSNKISALAGESSTGKTFFALQAVKGFLDEDPEHIVVYFDTEAAVTTDMFLDRGIDPARVLVVGTETIEQFRTTAMKFIEDYTKQYKDFKKPRMLFVLDSLGNLSSKKEVEDITSGHDARDMTKAQLIRGAFRVLTLRCGKYNIPIIVTNHTYEGMGMFAAKTMSGGQGLVYCASCIVFLSKAKEKEGTDVVGGNITCRLQKGRLTIEQRKVKTQLMFEKGLSRYEGMLEFAEAAGVFKKVSTRYETAQGKVYGKQIMKEPEKYFTPDVMEKIDAWCKSYFCYGSSNSTGEIDLTGEESDGNED